MYLSGGSANKVIGGDLIRDIEDCGGVGVILASWVVLEYLTWRGTEYAANND